MISSKTKPIVIVFALLLFTGVTTVGCGQKAKGTWVNTNSLPGNTFVQHNGSSAKRSNAIVYLGSDSSRSPSASSDSNFGPKDVNFDFKSLR